MSHIHIDVEHVTFGYEKGKDILKDVSLHMGETESIGIVGANGVGKVDRGLLGVTLGEELIDITSHVSAVGGDFPFVPNLDAALFEPADVVAGLLVDPKHFESGGLKSDLLRGENWKLLLEVELENLVR